MADRLWVGTDPGNEGDPTVAANWSPSGAPASSDNLYLRNTSQDMIGGDLGVGVDLGSFNVHPSFTGNIGSSGSHVIFNSAKVQMFGSGDECFIEGRTDDRIDTFVAGPRQFAANACQVDGKVGLLRCVHGAVALVSGATINVGDALIEVDGEGRGTRSVRLTIPSGCTITALNLNSGHVKNSSTITTVRLDGGQFAHLLGTLTTVHQTAGVLFHDDGTITLLELKGGMYDASRTAKSGKTLTTINKRSVRAVLNMKNRGGVGKPTTLTVYGDPQFDDGQVLTVV